MRDATIRARTITRRAKALTLVPLTALSLTATAAVLTHTSTPATPPVAVAKPLPDGTVIPVKPIQYQATPIQVGRVAPAVSKNAVNAVVASATIDGIPAIALNAYQRAAEVINAADPSCNMPWELIGAIGRVESNNGQTAGNGFSVNGTTVPGIYGPVLNGKRGVALIRDTEAGALDHNTRFDRAVGPMQFLPSTWDILAVDANGDGRRDPQNIYDASLASAVYLCSGPVTMTKTADRKAAVFRYNHSNDYVALVLRIAQAYEAGDFASVPTGVYAAAPEPTKAALPKPHKKPKPRKTPARPASPKPTPSPSNTPSPTPTPSPSPSPSPTQPDPIGDLLGLNKPKPTASSTKMSSTDASNYCYSRLILWPQHAPCTAKLTGLTKAQADQQWVAHQGDLIGWFNS